MTLRRGPIALRVALGAALLFAASSCDPDQAARAQEDEVIDDEDFDEDEIPILPDEIPEAEETIEGPELGDEDVFIVVVPGDGDGAARPAAQPFYFQSVEGPPVVSPLYQASRAAGGPERDRGERRREAERGDEVSFRCTGELQAIDFEAMRERLRELELSARGETRARIQKSLALIEQSQTLVDRRAEELQEALAEAQERYQEALDMALQREETPEQARPSS